jgi:hypothetical protein
MATRRGLQDFDLIASLMPYMSMPEFLLSSSDLFTLWSELTKRGDQKDSHPFIYSMTLATISNVMTARS